MSKVAVLDTPKSVLEPCHSAVARRLLREGKAAVYKRYPFTIILKREVENPNCIIAVQASKKACPTVRGIAVADGRANSAIVPHAGQTDLAKPRP